MATVVSMVPRNQCRNPGPRQRAEGDTDLEPGELQLRIDIGLEPDAAAEELDEETARLRRELLELDVEAVERQAEGPPPPGARAVEVAVLGTLLVGLGRAAVPAVVRVIESWVSRRPDRSVRLELDGDSIELSSVSAEEQEQLLRTFLDRHSSERS